MQYLKKEVSGEVDFLHAEKYACFLQIDSITFTGGLSSISKILKIASFQCLPDISKKKRDMKLIFLHADKHQSFPQVNFNILGIEVPFKVILLSLMNMIKHSQSTQSNKFTISQKNVRDGKKQPPEVLYKKRCS